MACGSCGQKASGGLATTSGDLSGEGRFVVTTPDGTRHTFTEYAAAVEFRKTAGGTLGVT